VARYVEGVYAVPASRGFVTYDQKYVDPQAYKLKPGGFGSFGKGAWDVAVAEYLSKFPTKIWGALEGPLTPEEAVFGSKEKGVPAMNLNKSSGMGGLKS